jgi:hypothetical protein
MHCARQARSGEVDPHTPGSVWNVSSAKADPGM